jgi:hypothetical protein
MIPFDPVQNSLNVTQRHELLQQLPSAFSQLYTNFT